jgi:predicted phosphate transport protein (TIGR00153 family)
MNTFASLNQTVMTLNSIFQFLVPKDKKFFPLFQQASANLVILARTLHEGVNAPKEQREEYFKKIEELEAIIEEITHKTHLELSRNFITPFDREDIHALIKSIDNVADNMHGAASRIRLYQVDKITKSIRKLTEINLEACELINEGICQLKNINNAKMIKETCKKINKLESKADVVFDKAVADIFENETDAKNIIKYKEVLSALEMASDKCKSVSNVMEQISVKHS